MTSPSYPYKVGHLVVGKGALDVSIEGTPSTLPPFTLGCVLSASLEVVTVEWLVSGDPTYRHSDDNPHVTCTCDVNPAQIERTYFL